jgi:hypothetical protein
MPDQIFRYFNVMKSSRTVSLFFLWGLLLFNACAGQNKKILFRPDSVPEQQPEQRKLLEQIVESQNGSAGFFLPEWVSLFLEGGIQRVEALDAYKNKYVFIGENTGNNFNALRQWADRYTAAQDFPMLVVRRVEQRLIAPASLYPDDEYGDYFAALIRAVSNAEYPGALKEESFWIRRRIYADVENDQDNEPRQIADERYEFFVLISMEKDPLQARIRELMADVKTAVAPTRNQTAAIQRIQQTFFEGF